jgi:dsRNA-specific ribonuclease
VQTREDGYTRKRYVVYECQLEGDWYELFEGKVRCVNEVKRFQGIGVSNRDAKAKAALAALKKLKDFMPGCRVRPHECLP